MINIYYDDVIDMNVGRYLHGLKMLCIKKTGVKRREQSEKCKILYSLPCQKVLKKIFLYLFHTKRNITIF